MKNVKTFTFTFVILLIVTSTSFAQNPITVTPLSQTKFQVSNNYGYPLTYEFQGKTYKSEIRVIDRTDPFSNLSKLAGLPRRRILAEHITITAKKGKYSKNDHIKVIKTKENFVEAIIAWALKFNLDTETIEEIFKYNKRDHKKAMLAVKGIIAASALTELRNVYNLYANDQYFTLSSISKPKSWKSHLSYNPIIKLQAGMNNLENYDKFLTYDSGKLSNFKLAISPFPEFYLSKKGIIASRFYLVGQYRINNYNLHPNIAPVYISTEYIEGNTTNLNEQLITTANVALRNSVYSIGGQLSTQFSPTFAFYVEGGMIQAVNNYAFHFKNGLDTYLENENLSLNQEVINSNILTNDGFNPYFTTGVSFLMNLLNKADYRKGKAKRGGIFSIEYSFVKNNLDFEKSEVLLNSSLDGFFTNEKNQGKFNMIGRLSIGLAL